MVIKMVTRLVVVLTLSTTIVSGGEYCDHLIKQCSKDFQISCSYQNATITSCCDLKIFSAPSGVYKLRKTTFDHANGYCDMTTAGGGWIVIQRNKRHSKVNFDRVWADYEKGFGDLTTEFWYGLDPIHCLTQRGQWEMRIDYQKHDKSWSHLHYNQFSVGSANENYPLTVGGFTGINPDRLASDSLNNMKFSTSYKDNDKSSYNCAAVHKSGWWYNRCSKYSTIIKVNINQQPPLIDSSILLTEMKIRLKGCITLA